MNKTTNKRRALLLSIVFAGIFVCCIGYLLLRQTTANAAAAAIYADIYQDGNLIETIRLDTYDHTSSFTLLSAEGGSNTVTVRPGEIAITAADCPDQICVDTGYIHDSLLPITCLPHKLVIQVRTKEAADTDAITY